MAANQYYLKDKKLSLWEFTTVYVKGVATKKYVEKYRKIWTYYRRNGGNASYKNSNGVLVYDDDAQAIFVINHRPDITKTLLLVYNHQIYNITQVDDYEGYKDDLKLAAKLADNQSFSAYNGLQDD